MNKSIIVGKREFLKVIRKPSFWISTLFLPIFIVIVTLISGYSSMQLEEKLKSESENATKIIIVDNTNYINPAIYSDKIVGSNDLDSAIAEVVAGSADALIFYPEDLVTSKEIQIYSQDKGFFLNETYNNISSEFLKQSILLEVNDSNKIEVYNSDFTYNVKTYKDGVETNFSLSDLLIPGISLIVYFMLTTFAVNYLLMSVSEEKENRVMEIVLSAISPKDLIIGKLIGLIGVIFTQVILLTLLSIVGLIFTSSILSGQASALSNLGSSFGSLNISGTELLGQILLGVIFTFTGFFILACTMVGVGAASPTYKEAQSLSSIFVLTSIFPIYFITIIISDPSGTLAQVFSFIPFTASFVLLFRNALGVLSLPEILIGIITLIIYCIVFVVIAFKLFEYGALEYNRKISFRDFIKTLNKKS